MNKLFQVREFVRYICKAKGRHGIHSPFVYNLLKTVILDRAANDAFVRIEQCRKSAQKNVRVLKTIDFGAGSQVSSASDRSIAQIVRTASLPPHYARILHKLVAQHDPLYILELGTSMGFTTAYMASATRNEVVTMEGCPEIALQAEQHFKELNMTGISVITGEFGFMLPDVLNGMPFVDFAFIDGNHRLDPTMHYFEQLVSKTRENSVLVFDDIHWSPEMAEAWKRICRDPRISVSIDLFRLGVVFVRSGMTKQHFVLRTGWHW